MNMKGEKGKNMRNRGITLIALVITIIVLLILAGVSIATLTGDNGILTKATSAKTSTEKATAEEKVSVEVLGSYGTDGRIDKNKLNENLEKVEGLTSGLPISSLPATVVVDGYEIEIDENGNVEVIIAQENTAEAPENWEKTSKTDNEWYSYADTANGNTEVNVNAPKLRGAMTPIKYVGSDATEQTGSKWANAITQDGSMWVWIPRYAYKITSGYHTAGTADEGGTIEVAFIDTNNNFLNGESGTIVTDPEDVTYTAEGVQNEWLVHPAFTSSAENGGGFGEITGIWVGKFEATGSYDSSTKTGTLSVKPATSSLRNMTINEQYKFAQTGTYGETVTLNSHMAKNSEWGAVAYLGQSKYGANGQKVQRSDTGTSYYTGGSDTESTIYGANKTQSTTYNAYGVYDMNGGAYERGASYVNYANNSTLQTNGGTREGDLYGANETERKTSTAYKTVYIASGTNTQNSYNLLAEEGTIKKGDAIYETSSEYMSSAGSWFYGSATFPNTSSPFFYRGSHYIQEGSGVFFFSYNDGSTYSNYSFRLVLVL